MRRGARGGRRRTGQTIHQWVRLGKSKTPSVRGCARPPHAFRSQSFQPTASRFKLDWCSRSLHVSKQEGTPSFPQGTRDIPERTSVVLVTGRLAPRHSAIAAYVPLGYTCSYLISQSAHQHYLEIVLPTHTYHHGRSPRQARSTARSQVRPLRSPLCMCTASLPRTGDSSLTPILVQISPTPQNGHPGYTTAEQDAKVHQLRMMLEAAGYKQNLDTLTMVGTAV